MTEMLTPEALSRLGRDVRAAIELTDREARFLVDAYYTIQGHRIEADNQARFLARDEEPNLLLDWLGAQHRLLERELQKVLDDYSLKTEAGVWARSILGIGPVIAAGLLAQIEIEKAPTVGHIWSFAGLNPEVKWERGQKRPWNAGLKVLCWKIGESFVKVHNRPCLPGAEIVESAVQEERVEEHEGTEQKERAVLFESTVVPERLAPCLPGCANYGHVYARRKQQELERNEAGLFREQAERSLTEKKYRKDTGAYKAYEQGKLPPGRLHARAQRYAVKLFLAHFHHVLWESTYNEPPPKPYAISQLGHAHQIGPPNWPLP